MPDCKAVVHEPHTPLEIILANAKTRHCVHALSSDFADTTFLRKLIFNIKCHAAFVKCQIYV